MGQGYTGPNVAPRPIAAPQRSLDVPEDAFGIGLAIGVVRAGEKFADVELEKRREADGVAVTDAFGTYLNGQRGILEDPKTGLLNRELAGAEGITTEATKGLDELSAQISANLKSDSQRDTFTKMVQSQRNSAVNRAASHESEQLAKYRDLSASVMIDATQQQGQALAQGPEPLSDATEALHQENIGHIVSAVRLRLEGKMDASQIALAQRAAISDYWAGTPGTASKGVIGAVPDGYERLAAQLLAKHKDEILPAARTSIENRINVASDRAIAQRKADEAWKKSGGDLGGALALAGEIDDAELRKETESRIRQRAEDVNSSRLFLERQVFDVAEDRFLAGGERVAAIPPSVWAKTTTAQRDYFRRAEDAKAAGAEITWAEVSDAVMEEWARYKGLPPERKIDVPLLEKFGHLIPKSGVMQLIDEQSAYRDAIAAGNLRDPKYTEARSIDEFLATQAKRAGLIPWNKKPGKDAARQYAAFVDAAQLKIKEYEKSKYEGKRKAGLDELQPIVDDLLITGELERSWWRSSPDRYLFEAPGDPTFRADSIPAAERAQIVEALKRKGRPTDDASVNAVYLRMHGATPP